MIKGREQFGLFAEQHPIAEHIARHVTDTHHGEGLSLNVLAQLAEVTLDGLPSSTGGNTHHLVVIAHRTPRGEGIGEPKPVAVGNPIGDVGEGRRPLVGGDHQIGIVPIMNHHMLGVDHLAVRRQVVGDVQQTFKEGRIGADPLGANSVLTTALWQLLGIEAALGPDRNNDRVFDLLRLDQTQDFRPEIVSSITPAQTAPRHRAEPQMHTLHMGRPDKDLAIGLGQRQVRQLRRGHLEADIGLG